MFLVELVASNNSDVDPLVYATWFLVFVTIALVWISARASAKVDKTSREGWNAGFQLQQRAWRRNEVLRLLVALTTPVADAAEATAAFDPPPSGENHEHYRLRLREALVSLDGSTRSALVLTQTIHDISAVTKDGEEAAAKALEARDVLHDLRKAAASYTVAAAHSLDSDETNQARRDFEDAWNRADALINELREALLGPEWRV